MSKAAKIIIVIIIALLALGVAVWAVQDRNGTDNQTTPPSVELQEGDQGATEPNETETAGAAATIAYSSNGFTIDNATVPAGSTVRITNNSQIQLDLTSNPHPTHEDQPELSVGIVEPGQSRTFVLTQPGTWGFHNHERDTHQGTITVE